MIEKVAISKNFFQFNPSQTGNIFDKRIVGEQYLEELSQMDKGLSPEDINNQIKFYEDRVNGWFLGIAKKLSEKENEAGFVVLSLAIAYIEGNQQYREGKLSHRKSKSFFIKGMRRIFDKENVPKRILEDFYDQVRCGLFHDAITKKNVSISGMYPDPVRNINGKILINPHKFLDKVIEDFNKYILSLSYDKKLRNNFQKRLDLELI
jgi:hypothetical protein